MSCIDGTHIRIKAPHDDEPAFVNRKGFHSINVLLACNPNRSISYVSSHWPGSSHDNTIYLSSRLHTSFARGQYREKGIILGDSGYGQTDFVMTPLLNAGNAYEERYNRKHKATRVAVEQSIGELKSRCRCLHKSRCLPFIPTKCCHVIIACVVINNIAIKAKLPVIDVPVQNDDDDNYEGAPLPADRGGVDARQRLIRSAFSY